MAYSTTAEINRILGPHAVTATTPVTTTDVDALRATISGVIDGELSALGVSTVPVANAVVMATLAGIESWGVTAQVLKALFPEATGPGEQPAFAYWQKLYDEAMKGLSKMVAGWAKGGLVTTTGAKVVSGYFTEHTEDEAELGDLEGASLFKVDSKDAHPW